jgi:hypothetical protein
VIAADRALALIGGQRDADHEPRRDADRSGLGDEQRVEVGAVAGPDVAGIGRVPPAPALSRLVVRQRANDVIVEPPRLAQRLAGLTDHPAGLLGDEAAGRHEAVRRQIPRQRRRRPVRRPVALPGAVDAPGDGGLDGDRQRRAARVPRRRGQAQPQEPVAELRVHDFLRRVILEQRVALQALEGVLARQRDPGLDSPGARRQVAEPHRVGELDAAGRGTEAGEIVRGGRHPGRREPEPREPPDEQARQRERGADGPAAPHAAGRFFHTPSSSYQV